MKFRDLMTGNILDAGNMDVIEQFKKYTDRYELVHEVEAPHSEDASAPSDGDSIADEDKKPGRPKKQ